MSAASDHVGASAVLLAGGSDPDAKDTKGATPLELARNHGSTNVVKLLTGYIRSKDIAGLLRDAADKDDFVTVRALVTVGVNPNVRGRLGNTPLHRAVVRDEINVVTELLDAGANPQARNARGSTPLDVAVMTHLATRGKDTAVIAALLDAGANPDATDNDGYTPMSMAKQSNSAELVAVLRNDPPLHQAATRGDLEAVAALLSENANPNARNADGETTLHVAAIAKGEHTPFAISALLNAGANANAKNSKARLRCTPQPGPTITP